MSTVIWEVQRRPQRPMLIWAGVLGLAFFLFSLWLIPHLMDGAWYWYLAGAAIGILLALMLYSSIAAGAHCMVDDAGICSYGFARRPNIRFPLQAVRQWRFIADGVLQGVGADIDIEAVDILHRKGLSISKMQVYQERLGYALILEFLNQDDAAVLDELSQRFSANQT